MDQLVNLTPHAIAIFIENDGETLTVPPSGTVARVSSQPGDRLPNYRTRVAVHASPSWGDVEGLPEPQEGKLFIVSGMVLSRCVGRTDVLAPGTGPLDGAIRDDAGRIVGVTRLIRAPSEP